MRTELVPVGAIELGDVLLVPAAELHDDLGGLTADPSSLRSLRVEAIEQSLSRGWRFWDAVSSTWVQFHPTERVKRYVR